MYREPKDHIFEYTNQSGEKITTTLNWDSDLEGFVKVFYLILKHASFTHKSAVRTFHKDYKDTLS